MRTLITTILAASLFTSPALAAPKKAKSIELGDHKITPLQVKMDKRGFSLSVDMEGDVYTVDFDSDRTVTTYSVYDSKNRLVNSIVNHQNGQGNVLLDANGLVEWSPGAVSLAPVSANGWEAMILTDPRVADILIHELEPTNEPPAEFVQLIAWGIGVTLAACLDFEISYSSSDGWGGDWGWDCPAI